MQVKISDFELGWFVGILEGEGYFEYNGCSQRVTVRMTDEDSMQTFALITSKILGKEIGIFSIIPKGPNKQELFEARVSGENARTIMKLVAPYMHYRRRARIWQSLNKHIPIKKVSFAALGLDMAKLLSKAS